MIEIQYSVKNNTIFTTSVFYYVSFIQSALSPHYISGRLRRHRRFHVQLFFRILLRNNDLELDTVAVILLQIFCIFFSLLDRLKSFFDRVDIKFIIDKPDTLSCHLFLFLFSEKIGYQFLTLRHIEVIFYDFIQDLRTDFIVIYAQKRASVAF